MIDEPTLTLFMQVMGGLIIAAVISVAAFITQLWRCVKDQAARGERQSRAIMTLTRFIHFEKQRLHPNDSFRDIEKDVEHQLKDTEGHY